jgi:HEAT repeat protein
MISRTVLLSWITLAALLPARIHAEQAQDAAGQAYRAAHKLVLEEKYPAAIEALQGFLARYSASDWSDDARFWICFSRDKMEPSLEKSFDCYQKFIQSNPKSEWVDDAKMNMVRVAHELAKQGKPQYEEQVRSFAAKEDDEIAIQVLAALLDIGDEGSLAKVMDRIDRTPNEEIRAKMVRMLSDHGESPSVIRKLVDIARKDPSMRVRESALRAVAETESAEALPAIKEALQSGNPPELRKAALRALADIEGHEAEVIPLLRTVAETETNAELAAAGVRALGDIEGPEALAALQSIYAQAKNPEIRKAAVRVIADETEGKAAVQFLLKVAATDTNPEIRRVAVRSLADSDSPEALAALRELASSNREPDIREAALRALGDLPGEKSVEALAAMLKVEKEARLRLAAVRALEDTEHDSAVPVLFEVAKTDPDPTVRKAAVRALGEIGSPAARDALVRLLDSK